MSTAKVVLFALALPLGVACNKDDKGSAKSAAAIDPFLTAKDLTPDDGVMALSQGDAQDALDSDSSLRDNEPDKPDTSDSGKCFTDVFDKVKLVAAGDSFSVSTTVDLKDCMSAAKDFQPKSGSTFTVTTAKMRLQFVGTCPGADLGSLNGATSKNIGKNPAVQKACETSGTRTSTANSVFDFNYELAITVNGTKTTTTATHHTTGAQMTAALGGCTETFAAGVWTGGSDCLKVDKDTTTTTTTEGTSPPKVKTDVSYTKLLPSGLKSTSGGTDLWYSAGKTAVTYNDWTGSVTYSGATAAPAYSITNGKATATGTVGVKASTPKAFGLDDDGTVDGRAALEIMRRAVANIWR